MIHFLIKKFVKDYSDTTNAKVRVQYGMLASIVAIFLNIICASFKLVLGFIAHSSSVIADGLNNFSDVGSNIASLLGFALVQKHPDMEHPYGHGRYEYLMGLVIGCLIFIVGILSGYEAIMHIIKPVELKVNVVIIIALIFTIGIKGWMFYFNNAIGDTIDSKTLKAAAIDSKNDVLSNIASIIGLLGGAFTSWPVDGAVGLVVSIIVIKGGVETISTMIDSILGCTPDPELVDEIKQYVLSQPDILGIHDMMFHDYGPGSRFCVLHAEVDNDMTLIDAHHLIDGIERNILKKYNIMTTIHYDPIETHDQTTQLLKDKMEKIVHDINKNYSIHDFHLVKGEQPQLICDILIPNDDKVDEEIIRQKIEEKMKVDNPEIICILQFDHSFI
ncbi:cation diffusion facilitator family transporter [Sharpea azabuensis]|uniref:cation diffusion facilitator family transporter n=1 Tax=Sharpea azabuensis TaxID=322505 RepID=UPI0013DCDC6C|nr:cation diffusion facilitator family transporter [Sharpea azabuensis]